MKRILVAGGAGFLGSNLIELLLKNEDSSIICVDNQVTGKFSNLDDIQGQDRLTIIEHDIIEPLDLEIDEIYNLACPASPIHYQKDPIFTNKTCFLGTLNLLELAKKNEAKILHASTSEIYGDPLINPQVESYWGNVNTIGPRSCYDEGKRVAETLCNDFVKHHGVDCRVVRIFNTYGPKMNPQDGRVVSNFIVQALEDKDITIYGDGEQTRSFCYVDDLVAGFVALMNLDSCPMRDNEIAPINLGNPGEFTMLELANKVLDKIDSKSELVMLPLPKNDPQQRKPDISRAKEYLDWKPKVSLSEGLDKTIAFFKCEIDNA